MNTEQTSKNIFMYNKTLNSGGKHSTGGVTFADY